MCRNKRDSHGFGENTNEIVKKLASKLGIYITETDISISHRLGTLAAGSTRSARTFSTIPLPAIIVKFTRRDIRDKLYQDLRGGPSGKPGGRAENVQDFFFEDKRLHDFFLEPKFCRIFFALKLIQFFPIKPNC